jgi:hypothetical protein
MSEIGFPAETGDQRRERLLSVIALAILAIALGYSTLVHFTCPVYPEDDAFIIYRYVDNIVAGNGPVYNIGQHVFGASCPLYVAGLAALKTVLRAVPVPDLAVRANFLPWLFAGFGLFLLLRRLLRRDWAAALIAATFIIRDDLLRASTGGMESSIFVALLVWALWALAEERFATAAILAGLSVPVRLEGTLLCAVVLVAWLVQSRRRALPLLLALVVPGLAWIVFGFAYYGTPVYHSIIAKSRPLYPLPFGHALRTIAGEFDYRVLGNLAPHRVNGDPETWRFTLRTIVLIALSTLAAIGYLRKRRQPADSALVIGHLTLVIPAVLFLLLVVLYLVTNPLMFPWYYPPLFALWAVAATAGIARIARGRTGMVVLAALCAFFAATTIAQPLGRVFTGRGFADIGIENDPVRTRIAAYRAAAEWLNQSLPQGVTIVGPEVGSLGYYYKGPVLDACGLTSPEALPFLPVPASERFGPECGAISLQLVQTLQPDVVVTMGTFAGISLYDDAWFKQSYARVRAFDLPQPAWNTPTVDVYIRADRLQR